MANNLLLSPPPTNTQLIDAITKNLSSTWLKWFNDLHYLTGVRNHQAVTVATAINLDARYVGISSAGGGYAITLAAPTLPGITKVMEMTADNGDVTMALTNVEGGSAATTCTWNSVGDTLILMSRSSKWIVIKEQGVALT